MNVSLEILLLIITPNIPCMDQMYIWGSVLHVCLFGPCPLRVTHGQMQTAGLDVMSLTLLFWQFVWFALDISALSESESPVELESKQLFPVSCSFFASALLWHLSLQQYRTWCWIFVVCSSWSVRNDSGFSFGGISQLRLFKQCDYYWTLDSVVDV